MQVSQQVTLNNFSYSHKKVYDEINRVNTQISSGKKIQHSYEDGGIATKSLRLDSEVKNLDQVQKRTSEAKIIADSADSVMSDFDTTLRDFKTKLLQAANSTINSDNYKALATELDGLKDHMKNLANTKVNGIYLFSGTNTNIKPIDNNGNYLGNDKELTTTIAKNVKNPFSIDGKSLFLGNYDEHKTISTNIQLRNHSEDRVIQGGDKIKDLIENPTDDNINFFISGIKADGTAFKSKVSMNPDTTVDDLLTNIGTAFGNTDTTKFVNVTLSDSGNIVVEDISKGKSAMDLKIVGVQGKNSDTETNLPDVTYDNIIKFTKSDFNKVNQAEESLQIDSFYFAKNGSTLKANVPLYEHGEFATNQTKLTDIANASMDGKTFDINLTNIAGDEKKDVTIKLNDTSTFTIDGNDYNIYNADGSQTKADELTQGQLNNIISMIVSNTLPASNDKAGFDQAVVDAKQKVEVKLDTDSTLTIKDKTDNQSKIQFAMWDDDANDFSKTTTPSISFMSNDLITTKKTEIDFFKDIDKVIQSVKEGKIDINNQSTNPRDIGIEDTLNTLDKFLSHFEKNQSKLGTYSKNLELENQKALTLQTNVKTLQSEVEDIDLADTIVKLNQLTLNYQAMLSSITKVNSLSLLSYLK